jgi:hypothetical protein
LAANGEGGGTDAIIRCGLAEIVFCGFKEFGAR